MQIGPYRILELVARGGMGVIYRARDEALGRDVAIKTLRVDGTVQRQRFLRECLALAQLRHPNVMPCYAAGEHEGEPYLVLPFLTGSSLANRLARGPLPIAEAAEVCAKLANALVFLHARGILHRDLKPDNVLFDEQGAPLLSDFGLVKLDPGSGQVEQLTLSGAMLGTPNFWPPEQALGDLERVGPASDVYGLGATLYCALTGEPPHAAESMADLAACLERAPAPPSQLRAGIPDGLERLVLHCLAKQPQQRPTMDEVADALGDFAAQGRLDYRGGEPRVLSLRIALGAAVLAVVSLGVVWSLNASESVVEPPAVRTRRSVPPKPVRRPSWEPAVLARDWYGLQARVKRGAYTSAQLVALRVAVLKVGVAQPFELEALRDVLGVLVEIRRAGAPAYPWEPLPSAPWSGLLTFDPAFTGNAVDPQLRERRLAEVFSGAALDEVRSRGPFQVAQPPVFPDALPNHPVEILEALVESGLPLGDRWTAELLLEYFTSKLHPLTQDERWRMVSALVALGAHVHKDAYPAGRVPPAGWSSGSLPQRVVSGIWRGDEETVQAILAAGEGSPGLRAYAARWVMEREGAESHAAMLPLLERDAASMFAAIDLAEALQALDPQDPRIEPLYRGAAAQAQQVRGRGIHMTKVDIDRGAMTWPRCDLWAKAAVIAARRGHAEESDALLSLVRNTSESRYLRIALRVASLLRDRARIERLIGEAELFVSRGELALERALDSGERTRRATALDAARNVLKLARAALDELR